MYEPDPDHWDWLLEQIASANLHPAEEEAIFDWLFDLFENPRPSLSLEDSAESEVLDVEIRDGIIPGTYIDARWLVLEEKKRFRIVRLSRRPSPRTP